MPGRTSTRPARSARSSNAAAPAARKATGKGRSSTSNVEIPDEGPETSLRTEIAQIFNDAQKTTATQRKLQIQLRKIQERCCYEQPESKKKPVADEEEFDAVDFNQEVIRCLLRVLDVKKGLHEGDRVINFLALSLKYAFDKDRQIYQPDGEDATEQPETPTRALIRQALQALLAILFPADGTPAHNKIVHYRATQTLTCIFTQLHTVDTDLYDLLRAYFRKLSHHKESAVRVQAVLGLSRYLKVDDDTDDEEDEEDEEDLMHNIMDLLLKMMGNDPSAEVRRAILQHMIQTPYTKNFIFERAMDTDPMVRRIMYRNILPNWGQDFRHMSLVEREKLLRWGLQDRDDIVRKAAARLFSEHWLEACARDYDKRPEEEKKPEEPAPPSLDAVTELLERIDVVGYGGEEGDVSHDAMQQLWQIRTDYRDSVTFEHDFWRELSAEQAFVARSLNDYCNNLDDNNLADNRLKQELEDRFPPVPQFAWVMQRHLNLLIEAYDTWTSMDLPEDHEETKKILTVMYDRDFLVQQLLHIALSLDYSPPDGRRNMFELMRTALCRPGLPEGCTELAVQLLRVCCDSESDFCAVIVETIAEVKDTLMPDDAAEEGENEDEEDSFHSAQSDVESDDIEVRPKTSKRSKDIDPEEEERRRVAAINVYSKCLHIAQCTLQNVVESDLQSNTSLVSILNTLIVPAVRGQEAMIRERGVECLALCSILSKDLAESNMDLFFHCFAKGHHALKEIVIKALVDIVYTHRSLLEDEPAPTEEERPTPNKLVKLITRAMTKGFASDNHQVALTSCTAASKLLLLGLLPPAAAEHAAADVLKEFIKAYFNPETASAPGVRSVLSYFLPTFCHSRLKNALLLAENSVHIIQSLLDMQADIHEEDDAMVGWPVIAAHLADWTDGRKVVNQTKVDYDGKSSTRPEAEEPHMHFASEILEQTLKSGCQKDQRKLMLTILTKLHIAPSGSASNEGLLNTLQHQVHEAVGDKIAMDALQRNYLIKLEATLAKRSGGAEATTPAPDSGEETAIPAPDSGEESATPEAAEIPETAPAEAETEEEEDTMMAGIQGESTRMPLDLDDDDQSEGAMTEDDIVESLLASEINEDDMQSLLASDMDEDDDGDTIVA